MRLFFRARVPDLSRILLIESGSRAISETLLAELEKRIPGIVVDLVTCYVGEPAGFQHDRAKVYRVGDYAGREGHSRLVHELKASGHNIAAMICSSEPIMTKWKWMLAARLPVKLLIVNENVDFFWFDYTNSKTIWHFVMFRAGLSGADAPATLARVAAFPFTLLFLLGYAAVAHARRRLNLALQRR